MNKVLATNNTYFIRTSVQDIFCQNSILKKTEENTPTKQTSTVTHHVCINIKHYQIQM
jgi:hypothetical protein